MAGNQLKEARKPRVRPLVALILPAQPQPVGQNTGAQDPADHLAEEGTEGGLTSRGLLFDRAHHVLLPKARALLHPLNSNSRDGLIKEAGYFLQWMLNRRLGEVVTVEAGQSDLQVRTA